MKRLFSLNPLVIILLLQFFQVSFGYLKISLQRRSEEYDINTSQIVSKNPKIPKCPLDITKLRANTSVVTELCFHRDVAFTIETLIGDIKFNYEVAGLGVDLHSPLSWLKSSACHSCSTNTTVTFKQIQNLTCSGVCVFNPMQTDFIVTNKYRQGKFASITTNTQMLYGEYILSKFSFLAYDPDKKKSIFKYIEEQFEMDTFEKYESLISFPSLKMIAATKLIGYEKYPADGGIGLGIINEERDSKIENGVDLMQALANAEQEIDKRVFGIYINELGDIFKDYALVLGGIDYQYSHRQNQNIEYVPVNSADSGHNWSLPLESITYNVPSADINLKGIKDESTFNTISTKKQSAILSLSTSFIALPRDEIMQLIQVMNRFGEADCKLVDLTYMAVYCLNFHTDTINTFEITFNFASGVKLSLDYRHIVRKCNLYPELYQTNDNSNLNDCLLNFQLSPTDFVILGEPFLKKHYTIFDLDNSKVGFLPAADNTFWGSEFYYQPSFTRYIVRIAIVIFVLGMVFIVCIAQVSRFLKWFRKKWDADDTSYSYPSEKLSFAHREQVDSSFNDQSFNDIELSARQADLYELKQQQIQEEQANQEGSQDNQAYQNASTNEDIQEHDNNNRYNIYPDIPQPPGGNNNGYSYDNQQEQEQQNEQRFDHGFNFVESNINNNNPFQGNNGQL